MNSTVQHLVAADVPAADVDALAARLRAWLLAEGIIAAELSACVPDGVGHAPGPHCARAVGADDVALARLHRQPLNGVILRCGRMVYDCGRLGAAFCPHCGHVLLTASDPRWFDALEQWLVEGGAGRLACTQCLLEAPLPQWQHEPPLGFGCLGLSFWNWPPLAPAFVDELVTLLGARLLRIGEG